MSNKRYTLIALAVVALIVSILACNPPATTEPKSANTVTPYVPATAKPQEAPSEPPPTDTPSESAPTSTPTGPTDTPTPSLPPATSTSAPTAIPTKPVSEGPLDFEEPRWVHDWRPKEGGGVIVVLKIKIIGGAPPFTVKHEGNVVGTTWDREFTFEFPWAGCKAIARNITVQSADGQSKSHDYYLNKDVMPWCD
jgi:hypothetical protein